MKITKILSISLAAFMLLAAPFADANAQTRKKGTKARTSTAAKKKAAAAPKAGPLTMEDFSEEKGHLLMGYHGFGDSNGVMMWHTISLDSPDDITIDYSYAKLGGDYSVSNNHLYVTSGGMKWDLTSPDGGNTLTGTMNNGKSTTKVSMFRFQGGSEPVQDIVDAMVAGKYNAYLLLKKSGEPTLCLPVKATFAKKTSGEGYTWKLSSDSKLMASMGIVKGTFKVDGDNVSFSDASGNKLTSNFKVASMPNVRLYVKIPGYRGLDTYLQLVRK